MKTEILGLLSSEKTQTPLSPKGQERSLDSSSNGTGPDLSDLGNSLQKLMEAIPIVRKQAQIIESLNFESIELRSSTVADTDGNTFRWILDQSCPAGHNFTDWLASEDSIFWITGKPGSGKSTLMKFLAESKAVQTRLQNWAGSSRLCVASHFFWMPGNDMQKSQQGLLRTLLYKILTQCPYLAPEILSTRWRSFSGANNSMWSLGELKTAFDRFRYLKHHAENFCFFIDGLDEYKGDHFDIINVISHLITSNIKICVSSRPWNIFEQAYGGFENRILRIHEHTRLDIGNYIESELLNFGKTLISPQYSNDYEFRDLVNEINDRANGVFLWVFLVVRSLKRGLINGDSIADLTERLRSLPTDLKQYFQVMLSSVEEIYHRESARIYLMCLEAESPLPLAILSFFDEKDPYFAIAKPLSAWDRSKLTHSPSFEKRVRARCPDLIEIIHSPKHGEVEYLDHRVQFLHRTVYDYLLTEDVYNFLFKTASSFDAKSYLCQAYLVRWKLLVHLTTNSTELYPGSEINPTARYGFREWKIGEVVQYAPGLAIPNESRSNRILDEIITAGRLVDQVTSESRPKNDESFVQHILVEAIDKSRGDFLKYRIDKLKLLMGRILNFYLPGGLIAKDHAGYRYIDHPDVVHLILSSQDYLESGESVLEDFLLEFRQYCLDNPLPKYNDGCARIMIRFLSHPAISSSKRSHELCYEIMDIVRSSGSGLAASKMEDVLQQFPRLVIDNGDGG